MRFLWKVNVRFLSLLYNSEVFMEGKCAVFMKSECEVFMEGEYEVFVEYTILLVDLPLCVMNSTYVIDPFGHINNNVISSAYSHVL